MRNSTTMTLFDTYGLGHDAGSVRNLSTLMQDIAKWHQSVWEFKKYTRTTEIDPTRSVQIDYGFMNCSDARERLQLRELYTQYFSHELEELLLHEACVQGRLASYLTSTLGPLSIREGILKNLYPLAPIFGIQYPNYDGMSVKNVISCVASQYGLICAMVEADGEQATVIPMLDECDEAIQEQMQDQAAFTTGRMYGKRRLFDGKTVSSFSVGR
jgi:hypothetical protein